jgi:hypothetical protein
VRTPLRHFYHLYCGGSWEEIACTHFAALQDSGAEWEVTAGLVGTPQAREQARAFLSGWRPGTTFTETEDGWEHMTLRALQAWAVAADPADPVLYAHAKGTRDGSLINMAWRESMTIDVVGGWRGCVQAIRDGADAAGPHWLDPAALPNMRFASQANGGSTTPYFGGNFWWARAGYLARLPEPGGTRWDAERWIGLGSPAVRDLRPGWPSFAIFAGPVAHAVMAGNPP